jgi:hypothetical protein
MVETIINNFKAFYHDIFRILIPGSLIATPVVSYLQCNTNFKCYTINKIFKYYEYYNTGHWLLLLALSYVFGNLILYILDKYFHTEKYDYYLNFSNVIWEKQDDKDTLYNAINKFKNCIKKIFKPSSKSKEEDDDILYHIRGKIKNYIKEDFGFHLETKEDYKKARVLLFKLMNKPQAFPAEYQTWIIFCKGMTVALPLWVLRSLFDIPNKPFTSIITSIALIVLLCSFRKSWKVVDQWIADRVAYVYYIQKRSEKIQIEKILENKKLEQEQSLKLNLKYQKILIDYQKKNNIN